MSINICRDNQDPFYRYKMPPIVSKIEGRGNGIKTAVVNTADVARALARPPMYVTKFFGLELGAQTSVNEATDRYMVNGAHDSAKLQDLLDVFIQKFVLCKACKNPETDIVITKDQLLYRDCKACGKRSPIDIAHKLSGVILKNPPPASGGGSGGKKAGAKKTKKDRRAEKAEKASKGGDDDDDDDDDDELTRRIQAEASALPRANGGDDNSGGDDDDDNDEWAADTSEEAVRARVKALESQVGSIVLNGGEDDEEDGGDDVYTQLGNWILERSADDKPSNVEVFKKMTELGIDRKHRTLQVLAQSLFDADILKQIVPRAPLLKKLMQGGPNHEKAFLRGTERFLAIDHPELIPSISKILHQFYENDIVSEEAIVYWGSHVSKKHVEKDAARKIRKAAQPFLTWLAEAEEDDDDDDDDDEALIRERQQIADTAALGSGNLLLDRYFKLEIGFGEFWER
ncbi:domain found in IF2B/IF5-domain-containing protein [Limtongia smithiae]|uniref:domain found in IF2B/IF5-domain-containing protein n=1 Tax=Limtongia smithiae TaxID=1125753 RepID=UPI0034CDC930